MKKILKENNIDNLYKIFATNGIDYVENWNEKNRLASYEVNPVDQNDEAKEQYKKEDSNKNDKFKERLREFFSCFITNETIQYLIDLYNNWKGNTNNQKYKALKNIYNIISDAHDRLNFYVNKNKNNSNNKELIKLKNEFGNIIRQGILNIKYENNELKNTIKSSNKFDDYYSKHKEELNNDLNLLKYLSDSEWEVFKKTLDYSFTYDDNKSDEENEKQNIKSISKRLIDIVKITTFDSKIPNTVNNFIKSIMKEISSKIIYKTYTRYDFGKRRLNMFDTNLKRIYLDNIKNDNSNYLNIRLFDLYRTIPENEFWKNVTVFSCYNSKAYNTITSMIYQLNRRNELEITSTGNLTTNLSARTILFIISRNDDNMNDKLLNRNGGELKLDNKPLNPVDKKVVESINRYYFIMVTEGYFKLGNVLSKISNTGKKLFKGIMNYNGL